MNTVIPWLNLHFLNFHTVLLHLPALDCGIQTATPGETTLLAVQSY